MTPLDSWTIGEHSVGGVSHPTYRRGTGPGVVVIHEIPGMTPAVIGFGEEVVAAGYTVVMPALFGTPGAPMSAGDLNLSPADLAAVKARAAGGCQVLGLRYQSDPMVGKRFETLTRELGDAFIKVEFKGSKHSTVTEHRQQQGVDRVLAFFEEKLHVH